MLKDKNIKNLIFLFFIIRIFYIIFQLISIQFTQNNLLSVFNFMDSKNYLHIANYGYDEEKYYAFFPFIPILIKIFGIYGVVLINNLCCLCSTLLLYKLFDKEVALLFLLSPIQLYCYIPYTESIFIFFTIISFYFYKNKKYLLLGLSLGLGVCCRSLMSMMFFAIFIIMFFEVCKKQEKFSNIFITYIPATIISCFYPLFLQLKEGNWKLFITVQYDYWDATKSNLFTVIYQDVKSFICQDIYGKYLITLTYITLILLCFVFIKYKEIDIILVIYTLLTILIVFSTSKNLYLEASFPPSTSYFRYFLTCFPMYIALSKIKNKKLIQIILIILHILISFNFILNGWPF